MNHGDDRLLSSLAKGGMEEFWSNSLLGSFSVAQYINNRLSEKTVECAASNVNMIADSGYQKCLVQRACSKQTDLEALRAEPRQFQRKGYIIEIPELRGNGWILESLEHIGPFIDLKAPLASRSLRGVQSLTSSMLQLGQSLKITLT